MGDGGGGSPRSTPRNSYVNGSDDASDMVPYEPKRPINKGKVILILTVIFVAVLVINSSFVSCSLASQVFHPRLWPSCCWP